MNKNKTIQLTDNELMLTLVGSIVGMTILSLPGTAVSTAKQDGWIAVIIGALYPLYVVIMAAIIIYKFPETNIMDISKAYLGRILGNFLNFLFMAQFLYYVILILASAANMLMTYAVWFMTPLKIIAVFVVLIVYGTTKGLKVVARINVVAFFLMCIMLSSVAVAFVHGSFLNLQPVFGAGLDKVVKGSIDSAFSYSNMELLLVIHPYVKNKNKTIKLALIATAIVAFIYAWCVFTTTFYLGPDIAPKGLWPFYFVTESVKIPVISNFRFFLMLTWPIIIYKTVATEYYMGVSIISNITSLDIKKWCIFLSPLILVLPLFFPNEVPRRSFANLVTPCVTVFNLAYITLIALLVIIRKKPALKGKCQ